MNRQFHIDLQQGLYYTLQFFHATGRELLKDDFRTIEHACADGFVFPQNLCERLHHIVTCSKSLPRNQIYPELQWTIDFHLPFCELFD